MNEEQTRVLVDLILEAEYTHNLESVQGCKAFDELEALGQGIAKFRKKYPRVLPPNPEELEEDKYTKYPEQPVTGY